MTSLAQIEVQVREYMDMLIEENVDPERYVGEVSSYLKSLASMERNPIASDLSQDFEAIHKMIS